MKFSTEIDNNFGYEKITQLVDNIPLKDINAVSKCPIQCINIDGNKCDNIEDICNNFNNPFSSVTERIT
jgi:hypothetical protein